ncbi:hypothetical protein K8T06_02300 [bacterium]|nr:hypothetical protein [bacterium]
MKGFTRLLYLILMLSILLPSIYASTIEGTVFLSDVTTYEDITVKMFALEIPYPIPTMTLAGLLSLLIVITFFLRQRKRTVGLIVCFLLLIGSVVVYAFNPAVYTTSEDGYYSFMNNFVSGRYYLSFWKSEYHPEFYGPFWVNDSQPFPVPNRTLIPTSIPLTTPTPLETATSLPTLPPGTFTNTPTAYPTCTPTPITPTPTPYYCVEIPRSEQWECNCSGYRPRHSGYGLVGATIFVQWEPVYDILCGHPCRYNLPSEDFPYTDVTIGSTCYPTPSIGWCYATIYLDPDLNCGDSAISFTGDLNICLEIPPGSGNYQDNHHYLQSGTIPIVTPAIVSDSDPG